jgi:hypothetical protein
MARTAEDFLALARQAILKPGCRLYTNAYLISRYQPGAHVGLLHQDNGRAAQRLRRPSCPSRSACPRFFVRRPASTAPNHPLAAGAAAMVVWGGPRLVFTGGALKDEHRCWSAAVEFDVSVCATG